MLVPPPLGPALGNILYPHHEGDELGAKCITGAATPLMFGIPKLVVVPKIVSLCVVASPYCNGAPIVAARFPLRKSHWPVTNTASTVNVAGGEVVTAPPAFVTTTSTL